jgi:hypothetical protein
MQQCLEKEAVTSTPIETIPGKIPWSADYVATLPIRI